MYRASSARHAENAAIQGEGATEWDTQTCVDYQQEILSSSPAPPPDKVASLNATRGCPTQRSARREGESIYRPALRDSHLDEDEAHNTQSKSSKTLVKSSAEDAPVQLRRDSKDRLRPFFDRVQRQPKAGSSLAAAMDDLTQKSSLSLTQENPESVYEQFNLPRQRPAQFQSTATPDDEEEEEEEEGQDEDFTADQSLLLPQESPNSKHHTESTGITYHEDDTGHVKLDFGTTPNDLEDDVESQDTSFPAPEVGFSRGIPSYEPETPAPAMNPFANKGTIMKGHELFGATQPTPSGPLFTSPNFRPSPDVYNNFSSPVKRRLLAVSPLAGPREAVETSPLQSSVRRILSRSTSGIPAPVSTPGLRFSAAHSFDAISQQQTLVEPRPYVSMKESQERRRRGGTNSHLGDSDSESDSESSRRRKRERDERIQRELSTVGVSKRDSSRPGSSNSPVATTDVEVPSTGRRRSWQDDYIAQCEGFDVRDTQSSQSPSLRGTQQDDVIADSQGIASRLLEAQQKSTVPDSPIMQAEIESFQASARVQPLVKEQTRNLNATVEEDLRESEAGADPSLPLQEASLNSRTRARSRSQIPRDSSAVPETSPTTQRFRPMGEVANISFSNNEELNDIPGFTQDFEYENAMGIQSSPPQKLSVHALAAGPVENSTLEFQGANILPDDTNSIQVLAQLKPIQILDKVREKPKDKSTQPLDLNGESNPPPTITQAQARVDEAISSHVDGNQARPKVHDTTSLDDQDIIRELNDLPATAAMADSPILNPEKGASRIKKYGKARTIILDKTEAVNVRSSIRKRSSARLSSSKLSTPGTTPQTKSTRSSILKSDKIAEKEKASSSVPQKRTTKRKSGAVSMITADQDIDIPTTRSSKRQPKTPNYKEDSEDPLAVTGPALVGVGDAHLFEGMVFAVSFVKSEKEKDNVVNLIARNGGLILEDGFDSLFESIDASHHGTKLELSTAYKSLKFAAVIADEHSRKPKYVQALALSLPSISGRWIQDCLSKQAIIDWSPYLLCAGQSSFLGNAHRSRTLQPYSATDASLQNTIESRDKLLEGQSVLMITGRGKAQQKRQTFLFLARALGPARVGQAADYAEARKKLLDGENQGKEWDLLHVDSSDKSAESAVFGSPSSSGLKKRKRGPNVAEDEQLPKKIRVINDETMIQSLIFGQLLEE